MTTITNKKIIKINKSKVPDHTITMYHWIEDLQNELVIPMRYKIYKQSKHYYFIKMIEKDWKLNVCNPKEWKQQPLYAVIEKTNSRPWLKEHTYIQHESLVSKETYEDFYSTD